MFAYVPSAERRVPNAECYIMNMSEIDFIVDELKVSFTGEAWHGPALMEVLDGVDAKSAAARPIRDAHSIWELVLHIAAWEGVIGRRIVHNEALTLSDEKNFPKVEQATEPNWREAVQTLRKNHDELLKIVSSLPEARLNDRVPGKDYDMRFMLHGAAQHAAYHGGQIALLKKL